MRSDQREVEVEVEVEGGLASPPQTRHLFTYLVD